jgi:hypothetical protein
LFVVPAVTAIAAWPILGAPIGATTVLGLGIAAAGMRLTLKTSDRQHPHHDDESDGTTVLSPALSRR